MRAIRRQFIGWYGVGTMAAVVLGLMSAAQTEPLPHLGSLTEGLRGPARIAIGLDDSVLITDPLTRRISRFDAAGNLVDTWPVPEGPIGVAVHPDGRIFVSLRDKPDVAIYDSVFNLLGHLAEDDPSVSFAGPTDIDIAADTGRVYVVDAEGDRIYVFEGEGGLASILGLRGTRPGQFLYPSAVTIDEPGARIIVAGHDMYRLQVFTTSGVFLMQFGDRLKSTDRRLEGWMPRTQGLAVDAEGLIYVADALMGTVRVFDRTGVELGKVVDYGYDPGQLRTPCDLALSHDGSRLYVANTNSSSVEVYDTSFWRGEVAAVSGKKTAVRQRLAVADPGVTNDNGWVSGSSRNGPHIVDDRPDICAPCHGITGQPGTHAGTSAGQTALCLSCHNVGGRALQLFLHESDLADPFATNPVAADGRGRSHAWGVPAVNPMADAVGPLPGGTMSQYLDGDGNIKCTTCHNQHNGDTGSPYLRVGNDGDAMCKECHAPRDRGPGEGGSHPVGFGYPESEDEFPESEALGPLFIKDGMVECMTCHAPHGVDSGGANDGQGDGMLLRGVNDDTLCRTCHTEHTNHETFGEWLPTCRDCHDIHDADSGNIALIAQEVDGTPMTFVESDPTCADGRDYTHGVCDPPTYDGICEVCHVNTSYHRNSPEGDHAHYADMQCTECHLHSGGFLPSEGYCTVCHGEPPDGTEPPNRRGSHDVHMAAVNGPSIADCYVCHAAQDAVTHDNGVVSFASCTDFNSDGECDLAETDVCDTCHSNGGPVDGVNDSVIGAKVNWLDGVYDGDVLKPDKAGWCAGCHDIEGAVVNGVQAPPVAGDNETWGDAVAGHGLNHVTCTDCHDPTLSHTDGIAKTFSEQFPLCDWLPKPPEDREVDRDAYNNGYRLRRIEGERALEVPRDVAAYTADDFRLCFTCHDEVKLLGVPSNYDSFPTPPPHLQLPEGVAQTNYRNESEWGNGWPGKPKNAHWHHTNIDSLFWDIDHDGIPCDSSFSCVTCHNPHGVRNTNGTPTIAMTMADLDISAGVYNDGETDYDYGYIGSSDFFGFFGLGGDLDCQTCHPWFGAGADPPPDPLTDDQHTRYYRERLDLRPAECKECHNDGG